MQGGITAARAPGSGSAVVSLGTSPRQLALVQGLLVERQLLARGQMGRFINLGPRVSQSHSRKSSYEKKLCYCAQLECCQFNLFPLGKKDCWISTTLIRCFCMEIGSSWLLDGVPSAQGLTGTQIVPCPTAAPAGDGAAFCQAALGSASLLLSWLCRTVLVVF